MVDKTYSLEQNPKVRLAVLTYNRVKFLQLMTSSILKQSYVHFEAKFFDNSSTDETLNMISKICETDTRFTFVSHEQNLGNWQNFALAKKWGEGADYFALLHDDDELHENWLKKTIELMESNAGVALVGTNANYFLGETLMPLRTAYFRKHGSTTFSTHLDFLKWFCRNGSLVFPSILYRSEYTTQFPFRSHTRAGAIIWYVDVAARAQVAVCFEQLMRYRVHGGQDSRGMSEEDFNALEGFFLDHVKREVPKLAFLARSWLAWHRLGLLRVKLKGSSKGTRFLTLFKEFRQGKLIFFSPIVRYYGSLIKGLLEN